MDVAADKVRAQIEAILLSWGMEPDLAATTTEAMTETDLFGVDSHGISMLMTYEKRLQEGKLKINARPKIERRTACTALIDAGAGLGHPVSSYGMNLAVDMAKEAGLGVDSEWLQAGQYEILQDGVRRPARMTLRAPVDPERARILS
jgi:LDH2 family malate/lactate/ureidoglycolate dehydrogenase